MRFAKTEEQTKGDPMKDIMLNADQYAAECVAS